MSWGFAIVGRPDEVRKVLLEGGDIVGQCPKNLINTMREALDALDPSFTTGPYAVLLESSGHIYNHPSGSPVSFTLKNVTLAAQRLAAAGPVAEAALPSALLPQVPVPKA